MRKHIFRGKRLDNGAWIEGYYLGPCKTLNTTDICPSDTGYSVEVNPETVGEYVGRDDKDGKHIFEGDIVKIICSFASQPHYGFQVVFQNGSWELVNPMLKHYRHRLEYDRDSAFKYRVIGNIHDNPELLRSTK